MKPSRPQQTPQQPKQQQIFQQTLPAAPPTFTHLYKNSVVGLTDERMRQLAEHFSP